MLQVVLDPNVFVSAVVKPDGVSAAVVRAGLAGRFRLVVSPALIAELSSVLRRPKFADYATLDEVSALLDAVFGASERHEDLPTGEPVIGDPGDAYLVGLAVSAQVDLVVSGDRDLHDALEGQLDVLTPGEFLLVLKGE